METNYFRYIPISPRDQEWGLFVTTVGHARTSPGGSYPPTRHPQGYHFSWEAGRVLHEHQVVYIARGEGEFESQGTGSCRVEAGTALLLFPGVWHRYAPEKKTGWEEYWVGFEGEYLRGLIEKKFLSPEQSMFVLGPQPGILELFSSMIDLSQQEPRGYQQVLGASVYLLLARILAASQSRDGAGESDAVVRQAKCIMLERMDQPMETESVAEELGIGYARFRQIFKRYTGLAPHQYHLQLRMNRARQLLAGTDLRIKQVSAQLGFDDVHYFCRIFRKKTGMTPVAWRRYARGETRGDDQADIDEVEV